jgi:surface protein
MKKLYVLLFLFSAFYASAQDPFITTWTVTGTNQFDLTIRVPVEYNSTNNYTINFGDGTILTNQTLFAQHVYASPGTYTVTMSGDFKHLDFASIYGSPTKIKTIEQWGDIHWTSMRNAFKGCINLVVNATDTPDLSQVTDMSSMFSGTNSFNQSINNWDVSNITDMSSLFSDTILFNQPLNNWDVSNVVYMRGMFARAWAFNQPLNNWNVSNVQKMDAMFDSAFSFNQSLDGWDVSNVTTMADMFHNTYDNIMAFNGSLNNWDVSSVTDMSGMFHKADSFNQPLNNWDVSNVTNMSMMFRRALSFNQPLNDWDVSNVVTMYNMFNSTNSFNQPLNDWDISNVTNMSGMFQFAIHFNQPLSDWNVSNVTRMDDILSGATSFNQDISEWDFSNISAYYGESYGPPSYPMNFVSYSGLDTYNYDALLLKFAQLGIEDQFFFGNGLEYCDTGVRNFLMNNLGWNIQNDGLAESCIGNSVVGNIRYNANANDCDITDNITSSLLINAQSDTGSYTGSSNSNGTYTLKVFENTYDVSLLNVPDYFTVTPITSEITFEGYGNTHTLNFCLTANETVNDLNVTLLPLEEARPGFETDYQLVVQNMGTQSVTNATVNLNFDNSLQTFFSASPAPTASTANQLTFNIANLQPFQTAKINLTMQLFEPPVVNGNEVSNFTATITPDANDFTPNDNTFELAQTIVNSYDPNDKRVLQGEEIFLSEANGYLNYIIRFQNTGTASAIKVRVKDVLNENLDWSTFQMVSASHNYKVQIKDGNQVEFIFDNINLPHEAGNEPGSHGFIAYKIKPAADVQVGDIINGNASIYFDYNLPIITNEATTTIIQDIEPIEVSVSLTNVSCNGENDATATVTATGGSGSYTYDWSPTGGSEATATGLTAGEYTVTVTDDFGNINILTMLITEPGAMTISEQPQDVVLTAGGNAMFSVNVSNVEQYQWQASVNGTNWDDINNGGTVPAYSGSTTATLSVSGMPLAYDGYKYRVLLSNGENCITDSSYATVEVNDIAGITEHDDLGISIYPNPAQTEVFINIPDLNANLKVCVLDINGRILFEDQISENLKKVNVSGFAPGIYIFTITSDKGKFSKHIIRQ